MPFFLLYLFSVTLLGSFYLGPFSIRVYMTIVMFVFLILSNGKLTDALQISSKFIKLFILYIVITGFTLYLGGEFEGNGFDYKKNVLAYYFPAIVTYLSILRFVNTTNRLRICIIFLGLLLLINSFVTLLQFFGHPFGKLASVLFVNSSEVQQNVLDKVNEGTYAYSMLGTVGLMGNSFTNANWLASLSLIMVGFSYLVGRLNKICIMGVILISTWACLATQGRVPFIMLILLLVVLYIKSPSAKGHKLIAICSIVILIMLFEIVPYIMDSDLLGRIVQKEAYESDSRKDIIWVNSLNFIYSHLFFGGPVSFVKLYDLAPHNYFLNAFVTSGILGGLLAAYIFFFVSKNAISVFSQKHSFIVYSLSASLIVGLVNSLFHNASIISGDTLFFIIYALFVVGLNFDKELLLYDSNRRNREQKSHLRKQQKYIVNELRSI